MWPAIGPQRWQELWRRYPQAEFVVGPAGFRYGYSDWGGIINTEGKAVSGLFARDPDSYKNLAAANLRSGISIALSHDPALYLRHSDWMEAHRRAATAEYDLAAFRDDHEANLRYAGIFRRLPWSVSNYLVRWSTNASRARKLERAEQFGKGEATLLNNDVSRQRFEVFVEVVRAARHVHTDRLHVLLLAAMMGKKVFAYPTAHDKLEGVYHHSLASWADVTLVVCEG